MLFVCIAFLAPKAFLGPMWCSWCAAGFRILRDVFSNLLHPERIKTDHIFCLNTEDITCGRKKRCCSCQCCASFIFFSCEMSQVVESPKVVWSCSLQAEGSVWWWVLLLHTQCNVFLIAAQQVKITTLDYPFTAFSGILQLSCVLEHLQSSRMISEQMEKCVQNNTGTV